MRTQHLLISIALSIGLITFGSIGYVLIEGWTFFDALYMTIITLATVGYSETHPISDAGRIFTMLLIMMGVGYFLYVAGSVIQFLVEGRIRLILGRRRLELKIKKLKNHYIICGYGRIGRVLTQYLTRKNLSVVIIEEDKELIPQLEEDGILYLIGSAGDDRTLKKAGIRRAKGLVSSVGTDADNVFVVLNAKQLNKDLFVLARSAQESTSKILMAAGADQVISPYELGARRMAHAILRPAVIEFLDLVFADDSADIHVEELKIGSSSSLIGLKLKETDIRSRFNLIIIAIKNKDDTMVFNPGADTILSAEDTLIVMGQNQDLDTLEKLAKPF